MDTSPRRMAFSPMIYPENASRNIQRTKTTAQSMTDNNTTTADNSNGAPIDTAQSGKNEIQRIDFQDFFWS